MSTYLPASEVLHQSAAGFVTSFGIQFQQD